MCRFMCTICGYVANGKVQSSGPMTLAAMAYTTSVDGISSENFNRVLYCSQFSNMFLTVLKNVFAVRLSLQYVMAL